MRLIITALILLFFLTACQDYTIIKKESLQQNTTTEVNNTEVIANTTNETIIELKEIQVFVPRENNLTIYFLDINGSSIIAQYKDKSILIDSGFKEDSEKILKKIRNLGIERLDYVFATNKQPKNIGGIPYIILRTEPINVVENGIPPYLNSSIIINNLIKIKNDQDFILRDLIIKTMVIYDDGQGFSTNLDDNSLVIKIHYGNLKFLFMSDCGLDCEERLKNDDLSADVLKISNSCEATSLAFLQRVKPKVAIVSANENFCPEIKDRFRFIDIPLYTTSEKGDVFVTTDGLNYMVDWKKEG